MMRDATMYYDHLDTPIGTLLVAGTVEGLCCVEFPPPRLNTVQPDWVRDPGPIAVALRQLEEYFAGERLDFYLTLRPRGTEFQRAVWELLAEIPYGTTRSYGQLARTLGRPDASRAVGAANGANPIPIILPCHRVIGANGSLTGFGGGLPTKRWLLDHERRHAPVPPLELRP